MQILPVMDWCVINEQDSPYRYNGIASGTHYDITRAARFDADGKLTEKPRVTFYFNGQKSPHRW
jgi:hypothetical protein